ncbi:39S ribosomal protein l42, mitochondrial-like [Plakobranchus ocellatus]|uniref:Large ribosomal subunit protein mL42 n=1 Tax=Plakobranchus ocellatus TaxID=259542 RepID=A0AAV4DIX3_9GAST|nr:39S ribosomal protein l42, mitochondrial-like [Plakobranchus ocellatus]
MATSLQCRFLTSTALLLKKKMYVCQNRLLSLSCQHNKSKPPDVCLSADKSMILCWHPEPEFPYEHTQPLPRDTSDMEEGNSVLKVQYLIDEKLKNRPDGPTVNELSELFHAHREDFKRRRRHEKKVEQVKYVPKDRDGL